MREGKYCRHLQDGNNILLVQAPKHEQHFGTSRHLASNSKKKNLELRNEQKKTLKKSSEKHFKEDEHVMQSTFGIAS